MVSPEHYPDNLPAMVPIVVPDPAPWWGASAIAVAGTLGGGVLGGVVAFFSALFNNRRRARVEANQAWEAQLIDVVTSIEAGARDYRKWVIASHQPRPKLNRRFKAMDRVEAEYQQVSTRDGLALVEAQVGILMIMDAQPVVRRVAKLQDLLFNAQWLEGDREALNAWKIDVDHARVEVFTAARDLATSRRRALGLISRRLDNAIERLDRSIESLQSGTKEAPGKGASKSVTRAD